MANSNRAIIRKAAIETGSLSSGLLNPEQARKFIQQTFEATNLNGLIRQELKIASTVLPVVSCGKRRRTTTTDTEQA